MIKEILSNGSLSFGLGLFIALIIFGMQFYFGYKEIKWAGFIFPIIFTGLLILLYVKGALYFNLKDIIMPVIIYILFGIFYENGNNKSKSIRNKELEKMKAKDNLKSID